MIDYELQPGERLLSPRVLSETYGCSESTQCRYRKEGSGPPFIKHNGKILYPESLVLKWYSSQIVQSTAELPADQNKKRYDHLAKARIKAQLLRKSKTKTTRNS